MSHPTPAPHPIHPNRRSLARALKARQVVTVTSVVPDSTQGPTKSEGTKLPIGPIVGGVVAGVAAVLLIGGIWYWCHIKGEKEKEERRIKALARQNKRAGGPTTYIKPSSTSMVSMGKNTGVAAEEKKVVSPTGGAAGVASAYVLDRSGGGQGGYGQQQQYEQGYGGGNGNPYGGQEGAYAGGYGGGPQQQQYAYGQERGYDSGYGGGGYGNGSGPEQGYAAQQQYQQQQQQQQQQYQQQHQRSGSSGSGSGGSGSISPPNGSNGKPSSSSGSSSKDRRARAQQAIEAALERDAAAAAGKYQPAKPSPLRAATEDERKNEWGKKPFRSGEVSPPPEREGGMPIAPVHLAAPVPVDHGGRGQSGEWGVAYSEADDGAGAFEHDDYDSRSDGRKSYGTEVAMGGRQATGGGYETSPRARGSSGGYAHDPYAGRGGQDGYAR